MGTGRAEHFAVRRFGDPILRFGAFARPLESVARSFPKESRRYVRQ